MKGSLAAWAIPKHIPRITSHYDDDPDKVPFYFTEVLGTLAPRPLFTNAATQDEYFPLKGAIKCLEVAKPIYALYHAEDNLSSNFQITPTNSCLPTANKPTLFWINTYSCKWRLQSRGKAIRPHTSSASLAAHQP